MDTGKFFTDFDYYTSLIKSGKPFAYARYADGEVALMQGREVGHNTQAYNVDRWDANNGMSLVGTKLLETLLHTETNYHYAISGRNDSKSDYEFLVGNINNSNLTFANLWINANYEKMKHFYQTLDNDVYLICNYKTNLDNFPFKVAEHFGFPDDCIRFFEDFGDEYIQQLTNYTNQVNGKTFFVSAGPVSEILIHEMYIGNPNNQYVDVGSSLDEFTHGYKTRPYMNPNSIYAQHVSNF